jgi:ATP-dependent Lon protease
MNVFEIEPLTPAQARHVASRLYRAIRAGHDWGSRFDDAPSDDVLDKLATLAPREMRRALMAAFGNARLASRGQLQVDDLPRSAAGKGRIGFMQ